MQTALYEKAKREKAFEVYVGSPNLEWGMLNVEWGMLNAECGMLNVKWVEYF
jgi:hypothetical protein